LAELSPLEQQKTAGLVDAVILDEDGLLAGPLIHVLERQGWTARQTALGTCDNGCQQLKPRLIFLTAGARDPDGLAERELQELSARMENLLPVIEASRSWDPTVVFFSSDHVFPISSGPCAEEAVPAPATAWGQSLLKMEKAIQTLCPKNHLIVRTSLLFGWDRKSQDLAIQVWENLQAGTPMRVANDQWATPTYVDYVAEVTAQLVQAGEQGIVHVAGKDQVTRAELAGQLAQSMGLDKSGITGVPSGGNLKAARRGLKTGRLEKLLGTEPLDLSEALKRFRRHWRADTHTKYSPQTLSDEAGKLKQEILQKVADYCRIVHQPKKFIPFKSKVPYAGRVFGAEEMTNLVDSSLDFWLTLGPYGELFEQRMKRLFGAQDFLLANSGSTANLLAVMTLMAQQMKEPLRPGDEVITTAVAFPTTIAPLVHGGLVPVFVDAEVGTYNINPNIIEAAISRKTRAILISHTLGIPCDMEVITDLAHRYHLLLIEDCCDALGATFKEKLVGTFGDLATLSFFPAHHITMGEGGGVVVNRMALSRIARSVRDWGRDCWCAPGESNTCGKRFGWEMGGLPKGYDHKYIYSNIGYNFKPTDMQAAIGTAQIDRIDHFVAARRRNFQRLYEGLSPYQDHLILPTRDPRSNPSWFGFPITVKGKVSRDQLVQHLEKANIETRAVFGGNVLRQPGYQHIQARVHGELSESDRIMRDTFFIGVYPGLTDEMIDFVLTVFKTFFDRVSAGTLPH